MINVSHNILSLYDLNKSVVMPAVFLIIAIWIFSAQRFLTATCPMVNSILFLATSRASHEFPNNRRTALFVPSVAVAAISESNLFFDK